MDEAVVLVQETLEDSAPRLSRAAVWVLALVPMAFLPLFRLTFPHVGLWPAAIAAGLSAIMLLRRASPHDRTAAKAGLAVAAVAFAFLVPLSLSEGIPGETPKLDLTPAAEEGSWALGILSFLVLIVSITLHECAHALTAWLSGDPTAKRAGRLTLNPIRHVDPFGSVVLPLILSFVPGGFVFGWAKPVPVDTARFRNPRKGRLAVSLSGVATNLTLAMLSASLLGALGIFLHLAHPAMTSSGFMNPWRPVELAGIPRAGAWTLLVELLKRGTAVNMILFWLNALPIPPLDGFGVLEGLVPSGLRPVLAKARGVGFFLFIGLMVTKVLDYLLIPGAVAALFLNWVAGAVAKLG